MSNQELVIYFMII